MKIFFLSFFLGIYNLCFCQSQLPIQWDKLYQGEIDSLIVIQRWGYTKETSLNLPNMPEEQIFEKRIKINPKKGYKLLKALQQKKPFDGSYPLLNDVCDTFYFYKNGIEEMTLIYTFSTKGLSIYRKYELIFAGKASYYLQKKISKVLGYNLKKDYILNN